MRILLINPPYQTLTSNFGVGHQVPLGLLSVGGPLRDAGHEVRLLDAECLHLHMPGILRVVQRFGPALVMTGHAGSTPAHPVCMELLQHIKSACPHIATVYGGVYPTYHAEKILDEEKAVDVIVRGEGEVTAAELVAVLATGRSRELAGVAGLAFRRRGRTILTPNRPPIEKLDSCRVGWELIEDWDRYHCFGLGRAAIVQFSRGCPHRCTYCGQHGFWVSWRHRDPARLVNEIEWLHRTHNVRFLTLADENPTTLRDVWMRFLTELASRQLPVTMFATIRATDIVRDADLLPVYREAGILYVLLGADSTDREILQRIHKGSTPRHDVEACRLLRGHGIFSVLGHVIGFAEEKPASLRAIQTRLAAYQADWLNAMYVTPHSWTEFSRQTQGRPLIEPDQRYWDYRHQVLGQKHLTPWQLFWWVKWMELWFHLRPRRLRAILGTRNRFRRRQLLWVLLHTGLVWLGEVFEFLAHALALRWRRRLKEGRGDRCPGLDAGCYAERRGKSQNSLASQITAAS
jgi:anaerobic magnesium-protoporphyrin IX monomethyl ester cyclase